MAKQTNPFKSQSPTLTQQTAMTELGIEFEKLAAKIKESSIGGREQSLALTNLEQASMWGNKAVMQTEDSEMEALKRFRG